MKRGRNTSPRKATPRRVAVVTGSRSEYGLLGSTIAAIHADPRLHLQLVVTGMHLIRKFGYTVRAIERDGWTIDARVRMQRGDDTPLDQAEGLARGVRGLARFFDQTESDIVLVLGDRIEAMAGALAATTTGRLVAHVHGGDVAAGDLDDALRHSVTKLAHLHLTATRDAARRVVRLGEDRGRVHVVGAPGLDDLLAMERPKVRRGALVVQHAYGRSSTVEARTMSAVLKAVRGCGLETVVIYPNTDRGHSGVVRSLKDRARIENGSGGFRVVRSLDRKEYLRLLLGAQVLVGNSSSGIIEAGAAGTPCVNVGDRQAGRLRARGTVIDAPETLSAIRAAVQKALGRGPKNRSRTPYGDGRTGRRIAGILATTSLEPAVHRKKITF